MIGPTAVPRRRLDARTRRFRGTLLVASDDQMLELSESAEFIYRNIDGARSVADIGRLVAAEYDIDEATAEADLVELLTDLADKHIVDI